MSGPLGGQLEELDVVPLDAVYGHWWEMETTVRISYNVSRKETKLLAIIHLTFQDGLLLLGRADESTDAFDDLALGVYVLLFGLLPQEDGRN